MNKDREDDIDEELVRSIQRLVEEENNVARAFVEGQGTRDREDEQKAAGQPSDLGATQMFDKRAVEQRLNQDKVLEDEELELLLDPQEDIAERKGTAKSGSSSRNKWIIGGVCGMVALVIIIIIGVAAAMDNSHKQSYDYNLSAGMEKYGEENYSDALKYLKKAYESDKGKRNTELMLALYDCYDQSGDSSSAAAMLNDLLAYDKYNEQAITALAKYYYEQRDGAKLTELIKKYKDTTGARYLSAYEVSAPTASEKEGKYSGTLQLHLIAEDGCRIFYTLDGSEPTSGSTEFKEMIELEASTVTLKAVAVNEIGVYSEVASYTFDIDYAQPDAPVFDPEAGEYEAGQKIAISNIPDGAKAYYTLDGTTPTETSILYTEPFELESSAVVSALIISEHDVSSPITRQSFVIKTAKEYSFNEAVNLLRQRMQALNIINSEGIITADNSASVSFVYQSRQTISGIDMYYIRCDLRRGQTTSVDGYYGVGVRDGQCYKVTGNSGNLSAVQY